MKVEFFFSIVWLAGALIFVVNMVQNGFTTERLGWFVAYLLVSVFFAIKAFKK